MNMTAPISRALQLCIAIFIFPFATAAQVRWDGGGGDGQWSTAANWVGDVVPSATNNVLLDNSIVSVNYNVTLPSGTNAITVRTLTISPSAGLHIEVILPSSNTLTGVPVFTTTGPGYGLLINNGGVFRNASGATSGNTVAISDSLRINNGGRYIHNTLRAHASLIMLLSKAPGTETGVFEFDVPGTASFIPSLPGRTYGTLILSSTTAGGGRTYSSTGVQNMIVRGDLIIGSGVTLNVSFAGNIIIKGNFIQNGGTFNMANNADNTTILLEGNLIQNAGTIKETGTAFPVIQLNGTVAQSIISAGSVTDTVTLKVNNTAGVTLQSPLSLPYKLELINGKVNTSRANLLILKPGCTITADSLSNNSFINGPLRKEGLAATDHFLFPVGKDITMRWLCLHHATGSFNVEFIKGSPQTIGTNYANGIDHISNLEYWTIDADATPAPSAQVELSFSDPNSGGITSMSSLRVAAYTGTGWMNAGNIIYTGTPGFRGSVVSDLLNSFTSVTRYFSLASSDASNPLPSKWMQFTVQVREDAALLSWSISGDLKADHFDVLVSSDNRTYTSAGKVIAQKGREKYLFANKLQATGIRYYRVCMTEEDGTKTYSKIIPLLFKTTGIQLLSINPTLVQEHCLVQVLAQEGSPGKIILVNNQGQVMEITTYILQPGINMLPVEVTGLSKGIYTIRVITNKEESKILRFVKL
jgi:hypothetical protein